MLRSQGGATAKDTGATKSAPGGPGWESLTNKLALGNDPRVYHTYARVYTAVRECATIREMCTRDKSLCGEFQRIHVKVPQEVGT